MELILRRQKNPISFLIYFQGLNDVIMSYKFTGIIFLEGGRPRSEGSKQTEGGGPKEGAPRSPCTWLRGAPCFGPPVRLLLSLLGLPISKIMTPINL